MLSVREVLIRGRPSKGGICMCVKDGGDFLGSGEKKSFQIACLYGPQVILYNLLESHLPQSLQQPFKLMVLVVSALREVLALGFC